MKWARETGALFETSDCLRYTVCVARLDGKLMYQAWRNKSPGELLHTDPDAQVCRDACAKHAGLGPVETDLRAIVATEDRR